MCNIPLCLLYSMFCTSSVISVPETIPSFVYLLLLCVSVFLLLFLSFLMASQYINLYSYFHVYLNFSEIVSSTKSFDILTCFIGIYVLHILHVYLYLHYFKGLTLLPVFPQHLLSRVLWIFCIHPLTSS